MPNHILKTIARFLLLVVVLVLTTSVGIGQATSQKPALDSDWISSQEVQASLEIAGENRAEWNKSAKAVPEHHRSALKFLLTNMPEYDLKHMTSDMILENIKLAFDARENANWKISDQLFFNDVLPYANIDEPRDAWRADFYQLCRPLVADCKTPGEAALKLNETVFKQLSVKYSTQRKRANQSPSESIEQGLASCTGLSIILVDACRSVGVPARLAGIPSWKNKRGNHTWVEVWDDGWHFLGAAEPDSRGLNHTWFQGDAALADPNSKMHSIYAVSFAKTETAFPMVWSPEKRVYAENVTARYLPKKSTAAKSTVNVNVRVWNAEKTERQTVMVKVLNAGSTATLFSGDSKSGTADMNDMLSFELNPNAKYDLILSGKQQMTKRSIAVGADPEQFVDVLLPGETQEDSDETNQATSLSPADQAALTKIADKRFFSAEFANAILRDNPEAARKLAWQRYLQSTLAQKRKSDYDQNQVTFGKYLSPYTIKTVGARPENGWPIFIAMHGGGGAPQSLNDSQWRHMQIYYKDQTQFTGYKYLALRAPNNTWNGFYDDYVYPLIENLIQQFVVLGDVDPNKVFIMGYSHGGYGAFAIGPKIPDRFAAIHASAAAPTGGQTSAKSLRNTRFTFMVGEKDTAYGRRERCDAFAEQIKELGYSNVEYLYKPGYGHGGLPDRDMISQMYDHVRNPVPKHVTWEMTDSVVDRFYWLSVEEPARGQLIDAEIKGNTIRIKTENCKSLSVFLDRRLIEDPKKPIEIVMVQADGERSYSVDYQPSFKTLCDSIAETSDVNLSFDFEIKIDVEN